MNKNILFVLLMTFSKLVSMDTAVKQVPENDAQRALAARQKVVANIHARFVESAERLAEFCDPQSIHLLRTELQRVPGNLTDVVLNGKIITTLNSQNKSHPLIIAMTLGTEGARLWLLEGLKSGTISLKGFFHPVSSVLTFALEIGSYEHEKLWEILKALIDAGTDVSAPDNCGIIPLFKAAQSNNAHAIYILLDAGAAIDAKNQDGETALFEAARSGSPSATAALLARGADRTITNAEGLTALNIAERKNKYESGKKVIELLTS